MVILKPITVDSVASLKAVRLRALRDTPSAFGSTYANESRLSDAEWAQRVAQWHGERSTCYLAWDGDQPCGIAAAFLERDDPTPHARLVSMWVAPSHRGRGVGRLLVGAVIDWARGRRVEWMCLTVTSNNDVASRFYTRLGFTKTGKVLPYPNDPALVEFEMTRPIEPGGPAKAG